MAGILVSPIVSPCMLGPAGHVAACMKDEILSVGPNESQKNESAAPSCILNTDYSNSSHESQKNESAEPSCALNTDYSNSSHKSKKRLCKVQTQLSQKKRSGLHAVHLTLKVL